MPVLVELDSSDSISRKNDVQRARRSRPTMAAGITPLVGAPAHELEELLVQLDAAAIVDIPTWWIDSVLTMALGPVLIFDKSALESLNPDEALWLDNFFLTNITPLFFVETLADLEKSGRDRTPEQIVGNLAYKTPDMNSCPNVHHTTLLEGELLGKGDVDMHTSRPIIRRGKRVTLEGKTGVIFEPAPEELALHRWQRHEFLELERQQAKAWRLALSNVNLEEIYTGHQGWFLRRKKPHTLAEVKSFAHEITDSPDIERTLRLGLAFLGAPEDVQKIAVARWQSADRQPIKKFAPYFYHVFSVDLFFYLAVACDLISRDRPSNKIDLAYLYYLPFCMVFTSKDKLHVKVAPLFLTPQQTFIDGPTLKGELSRLDTYYSLLPDEILRQGIYKFADYPPTGGDYLVSKLWDKFLPSWRESAAARNPPMSKEAHDALVTKILRFKNESIPAGENADFDSDSADKMIVRKIVRARRGKWRVFPPEIEKTSKPLDEWLHSTKKPGTP